MKIESEISAFQPYTVTPGGNTTNDFPQEFCAVYAVKVNRDEKVCPQLFTQDSRE